jgi:hypothetical protein
MNSLMKIESLDDLDAIIVKHIRMNKLHLSIPTSIKDQTRSTPWLYSITYNIHSFQALIQNKLNNLIQLTIRKPRKGSAPRVCLNLSTRSHPISSRLTISIDIIRHRINWRKSYQSQSYRKAMKMKLQIHRHRKC